MKKDRTIQYRGWNVEYSIGDHISWWNNPSTDRFSLLKKYGYQDEKKPWKYRPLSDKGIYIIYKSELT